MRTYLSAGEDAAPIRERYTWFLEDLFGDTVPEKKKGQRKKPLAELIYTRVTITTVPKPHPEASF